jgi:hypothetical protein
MNDQYEFSEIERMPQFWIVRYWVNGSYLTHDKFYDYFEAVIFANTMGANIAEPEDETK